MVTKCFASEAAAATSPLKTRMTSPLRRRRVNPQREVAAVAAADASDDIEITDTFDEVEFGDGDESHHIYTNINGVIITWNTCAEDTFKVFRKEIADMFGLGPQDCYIALYATYIRDDHRARDLPRDAWVSINFRCHGGGKRGATGSVKESKGKDNETEKKLALMRIEEGAKKFVAT
ncbi:MAG: hypothetical protein ACKPKO_08830, partial [Candidatus Fonsibacter sp.]